MLIAAHNDGSFLRILNCHVGFSIVMVANCRASPTLSEEAQHAMRLPPVAVSRRRRTGVVLPEQLPADAGGGGAAGSSSVSEESDATPGAPPPKKRRSGARGLAAVFNFS